MATAPWHNNTDDDYEAAAARCEIRVAVDNAGHKLLCRLLRYDKRQSGSRGRALTEDVPQYALRAGDRLEPSIGMPDIGRLEEVTTFPLQLVCWRRSEETLV